MAGACLVPPQAEQPVVEASAGFGDSVLSPIPFVNLPVNGPSIRKMLGIDNVEQSCALYQGTKPLSELKSLKDIGKIAKLPQVGRELSRGLDEKFVVIPDLF